MDWTEVVWFGIGMAMVGFGIGLAWLEPYWA